MELVGELVAGTAGAVPQRVAPWIMKPLMTRWKTVPSYSGSVVFWPSVGRVHSRAPVASSTKFRTVFGAKFGSSSISMSPWLVFRVA